MEDRPEQRLSQIQTAWTVFFRAHIGSEDEVMQAQAQILERYQTAIHRYLLGAVRDRDTADELFQDFALRFVRGDFGRAEPGKGRFRDYLRRALINLISTSRNKPAYQRTVPLDETARQPETTPHEDLDREFLNTWRTALLDRAWEGLARLQKPETPPYYTALKKRTELAELTSEQLAAAMTVELRPAEPYTDAGVRKLIQRARELFTDLLIDEVARSLQTSSIEVLEQEVIDLGFQAYCQRALERRKARSARG